MTPYRVLILDLNPRSFPEDNCGQLPKLIENILPNRDIYHQTITNFPPRPIDFLPDLIFLRSTVESFTRILLHLRKHWNKIPIIGIFCNGVDDSKAVFQSLVSGLDDFVSCPFKKIDLAPRMLRLIHRRTENVAFARARAVKETCYQEPLVGESQSFLRVIEKIPSFALSNATVALLGETGTGKELVARAIHYNSPRHGKPFIPVNCSALPEHLLENELFGHAKGAFTDASSAEKGLVAEAEGGTLFLDEVGTLSLSAQAKLLRFLQNKEYRHLGSSKSATADVRVISATNADLRQLIEAKLFREDLFHRLNVLSLTLPPLRDRVGDIPLLAAYFLDRYANQMGRNSLRLSPDALQKLIDYHWPGNVRELEGVIHRTVVLCLSSILRAEDIDLPAAPSQREVFRSGSLQEAKMQAISQFERHYLTNLLIAHRGNISHAAKAAGKERRTFQRLLRKYDLDGCAFRAKNNVAV